MSLSEFRTYSFNGNLGIGEGQVETYCYEERHVKEFIRQLREKLKGSNLQLQIVEDLAGDKLL
jgi:hypothetical protein